MYINDAKQIITDINKDEKEPFKEVLFQGFPLFHKDSHASQWQH